MSRKKDFGIYIGFISIILLILINIFPLKNNNEEELSQHGIETAGKVINFKTINPRGSSSPKQYLDYIFAVNEKDYINEMSREKYPNVKKGSFYKIIYSSKDPKINKIILDEEITDTSKIIEAGFEKHTKVRKYDFNGNFLFEKDTLFFRR
jgi:hypothetical protein